MTTKPAPRRRTSGGPVLQDDVTEAIESAYFAELADVGYGRLSIDAVAKRAAVGKAAVYRRWRSKLDMTMALVSKTAVAAVDVPDTGTLRGDIVREPRRLKAVELFERAVQRGELPAGTNLELSMDVLAGPLYWRLAVMGLPVDDDY